MSLGVEEFSTLEDGEYFFYQNHRCRKGSGAKVSPARKNAHYVNEKGEYVWLTIPPEQKVAIARKGVMLPDYPPFPLPTTLWPHNRR